MAKKTGMSAKTAGRGTGRGQMANRAGGGRGTRGAAGSLATGDTEMDVEYVRSPGERGRQGRRAE
ncbi:MAG: hypothetical protein EHM24_15450, partial [Acidobacteria bacterium]